MKSLSLLTRIKNLNFYQKKGKKKKKEIQTNRSHRERSLSPNGETLARNLERACIRPKRGQQRKDRNEAEIQADHTAGR